MKLKTITIMQLTKIIKSDLTEVLVRESPRHIADKVLNAKLVITVHNKYGKKVNLLIDSIASFAQTVEVEECIKY